MLITITRGNSSDEQHWLALSTVSSCPVWGNRLDKEVGSLFQQASIVLMPYRDATQSGVATIAAVFGCASVAMDVGDLSSAVIDGVSGRIAPAGDIQGFSDHVSSLLAQPEVAIGYGKAALELYSTGANSWCTVMHQLMPHYQAFRDGTV